MFIIKVKPIISFQNLVIFNSVSFCFATNALSERGSLSRIVLFGDIMTNWISRGSALVQFVYQIHCIYLLYPGS